MSKFRIKLKLQGLEIELEGSREDVPLLAQNIGNQLAGVIAPAAAIAADESAQRAGRTLEADPIQSPPASKRRTSRRTASPAAPRGSAPEIEFRHDPSAWGNPQQDWNTASKAQWLIYVVGQSTTVNELSSSQIAALFKKHFRQAGVILAHNVSRDLGKLKGAKPPVIGEDASTEPSRWYLTEAGVKVAKDLVKQARGEPT